MPKGPQGQWRPADPRACTVHVMKIATGEIVETLDKPFPPSGPPEPEAAERGEAEEVEEQMVDGPIYGSGLPFPRAGQADHPGEISAEVGGEQ